MELRQAEINQCNQRIADYQKQLDNLRNTTINQVINQSLFFRSKPIEVFQAIETSINNINDCIENEKRRLTKLYSSDILVK